ncbi:LysR family transcriptional regulator [Paramicrobacterium chengjingii]|uniref:LysR family transcriptional regulator n=1 Tax=Paramicrobacterium chengjingii TaxID=2769067 RepID=UPI001421C565
MLEISSITLRQLDCLRAVVESGSVSEAARRMHLSPGGVSLAITELERQLDVQLTLRTRGRGVEITSAGRSVYERAVKVADEVRGIHQTAATLRGELTGPLRLGVFTTLSPWFLPQIVEHITQRFPAIDLQPVEDGSIELQAALLEGGLDATLIYENHLTSGVKGHRIAPVRLQLAVAPTHRLARRASVYLSELEDEDCALLASEPASAHVEEILRNAGMTPRVKWRSVNVETIRSLVARGLAYTIIMGRPYGDRTYEGLPITYRPIADEIAPNAVVFGVARGAHQSANVRELLSYCLKNFGTASHGGQHEMGRLA